MLDDEPTTTTTGTTDTAGTDRRRAADRPAAAGRPAARPDRRSPPTRRPRPSRRPTPSEPAAGEAAAAPAAKRTRKRATKAAKATARQAAGRRDAGRPTGDAEAPGRRPTRPTERRPRRRSGAAPARKRATKRTSKKARGRRRPTPRPPTTRRHDGCAPAPAPPPTAEPASAPVGAPGVLFQPPEPTPAPRRRRAAAKAAAPETAEPEDEPTTGTTEAAGTGRTTTRPRTAARAAPAGAAGAAAVAAAVAGAGTTSPPRAAPSRWPTTPPTTPTPRTAGRRRGRGRRRRRDRRRGHRHPPPAAPPSPRGRRRGGRDRDRRPAQHRRARPGAAQAQRVGRPLRPVRPCRPCRPGDEDDDGVRSVKGSTRLEAKKQRRREGREAGRRRPPIITEAEFLARREAVDRVMVVRQAGERTQIAVLEDGVLVEHYVSTASSSAAWSGNVYLGKVQNVLPSMEAAFVDIGKGRNAVLYAGEVNWDAAGLEGQPRRIELALKSGDPVLVQVTKDPIGHKGARLTSQVSLAGRYLVLVPGRLDDRHQPQAAGHRAHPPQVDPQDDRPRGCRRHRPHRGGGRQRGGAQPRRGPAHRAVGGHREEVPEGVLGADAALRRAGHDDPRRPGHLQRGLHRRSSSPATTRGTCSSRTSRTSPRTCASGCRAGPTSRTCFGAHRIDEQLAKALDRKVWLPSGGYLVIDRTEAMIVVDVNTGKFTGQGGNLEETVTKNNLEAAEEIVRQLRLRDLGGIIVIDFIDMVLESNRDLVLRRLLECLGRDRTKHQVAEVTSLGLVQMTRKRVGQGLHEAFSTPCEACNGRGYHVHTEPVETKGGGNGSGDRRSARKGGDKRRVKAGVRATRPTSRRRPARAPAAAARAGSTRPTPSRRWTPRRSTVEDPVEPPGAAARVADAVTDDAGRRRAPTPLPTSPTSRPPRRVAGAGRSAPPPPSEDRAGTGRFDRVPAGFVPWTVPIPTAPRGRPSLRAHRGQCAPRSDASRRKRAGVHDGVRDRPCWWTPGEGRRRRRPRDRPGRRVTRARPSSCPSCSSSTARRSPATARSWPRRP